MLHTLNLITISCPLALSLATKQKNIKIDKENNFRAFGTKKKKKLGLLALGKFLKRKYPNIGG